MVVDTLYRKRLIIMGLADYLFSSRKPAPKDLGSGLASGGASDIALRKQYLDYSIEMQSNGQKALPYEQWAAGRK
jgi:hypothetical protein